MLDRSYSRHSRVISHEIVTVTSGSAVRSASRTASSWARMRVRVEQTDGHGLDRVLPADVDSGTEVREIERNQHVSPAVDALANLEAVPPGHERRRLARHEVVHVGPVAPADLEDVAEARGRHERRSGAAPLGQRVDDHRGPVDELGHVGQLDVRGSDGVHDARGEIGRRGGRLRHGRRPGGLVEGDEVRERAADVRRQSEGHALRSRDVSTASSSSVSGSSATPYSVRAAAERHVAVDHVRTDALRVSLARIAEAGPAGRHGADDVAVGERHPRHAAVPGDLVAAHVLQVVVRARSAAGESPRPTPRQPQRPVAVRVPCPVDAVLAHDAESAPVAAGAAARGDVELVAVDEDGEARLDDLDRKVVGVSVGRGDQGALAVADGAAAPAADVGLGEHEQLVRLGVPADDVRAAEARVGAGAEAVRAHRRQRLPEQVVRARRSLVVPAGGGGRLRAEHRPGRHGQGEGCEEAVVRPAPADR